MYEETIKHLVWVGAVVDLLEELKLGEYRKDY